LPQSRRAIKRAEDRASVADRVSVFEKRRLVKTGAASGIFASPRSAYTRRLLGAIPAVTDEEARAFATGFAWASRAMSRTLRVEPKRSGRSW
jgi:ABC-type dipeptide/oligopeptide/nickel transport system ATPase component